MAYRAKDIFIVEDCANDESCKDRPNLADEHDIRFYAAVPLAVEGGYSLGNLCVADSIPRRLSEWEAGILKKMGSLVVNQLETHLSLRKALLAKTNILNSLQAVLDHTSDNIVLLNTDYSVLRFNDTMRRTVACLTGKEISHGDDFRQFVVDDLKETFASAFARALKGIEFNLEHLTESGEISRWFSYSVKPVYDHNQLLIGISLTARDIDKAKRAELAIRKNAYTLQAILDNTSDSIILMDVDYKILSINKVAQLRLLRLRGDKLQVGDDHRQFLEPQNEYLFYRGFQKALQGEKTEIEHYTVSRQGSGWFRYKMAPVYDDCSELIGVAFTCKDIDRSKKFELALLQSEQKFRKIVSSAANPIFILDKQMNIVLVNPEGEKTFGYTAGELAGEKIELLMPERRRSVNLGLLRRYIANPKPIRMGINRLMPALKKNGEEIQIETSLNTFELDNEVFVLVILQDVTARIHSEQRIKKQVEQLKAIAWQQSHQVRQPIVNILGFVDLIKNESDRRYNEQYLDLLKESTEELDRVIHKIVAYTAETKKGGSKAP